MSLEFYERTRINEDKSVKDAREMNNSKIESYNERIIKRDTRNDYIKTSSNIGVFQDRLQNYTNYIEIESDLRNGISGNQSTNPPHKKDSLLEPNYITGPDKSSGHTQVIDANTSNELRGILTNKNSEDLRGHYSYRVIPLIYPIKKEIQNIEHIIPTHWVRGGLATNNIIRNINYQRECGNKFKKI